MGKSYKYHLRPGHDSHELLLEFIADSLDANFYNDLMTALKEINPKVNTVEDLWMNDEVLLQVFSDKGSFFLSIHTWGFAFITAEENQPVIKRIDEILSNNSLFEKEEVDFENYKSSKA